MKAIISYLTNASTYSNFSGNVRDINNLVSFITKIIIIYLTNASTYSNFSGSVRDINNLVSFITKIIINYLTNASTYSNFSGNVGDVFQGGRVQEHPLLPLLLPRRRGRKEKVRTSGLIFVFVLLLFMF